MTQNPIDPELKLHDFDYNLPTELIAQYPVEPRDACRLMVLDKNIGSVAHRMFPSLLEYLHEGDTLVFNDTRVIPARLWAKKAQTGGVVEVLLLSAQGNDRWEAMLKPGRRVQPGTELVFGDGELTADVLQRLPNGGRILQFKSVKSVDAVLHRLGQMPLPPYIKARLEDPERYQTVYSHREGSAAAPTAGLHFTDDLLKKIDAMGVRRVFVTLNIGLDTFRPVREEKIAEHEMHSERFEITEEAAEAINNTPGRIFAVGTTSARTLESAADGKRHVRVTKENTRLFITPGYEYQVVEGMITNFHLPCSTLLMMISALAGRDRVLAAYEEAVREKYKFFSFGDAMLIL